MVGHEWFVLVNLYFCDFIFKNMNQNIGWSDIWRSSSTFKIKLIKSLDYALGSLLAFVLPARESQTIAIEDVKNILIIRPGGIGDAVVLLPVIDTLKAQYPQINIEILCEARNAEVFLSQARWVQNVYRYDHLNELFKVLKSRYDLVLDTEQWHYLSSFLGSFVRKNALIGFGTRPLRRKLLDVVCDYDENSYELVNFIKLVRALGIRSEALGLEEGFIVGEHLQQWASEQLKGENVAFLVGASIPERRLTVVQMKEIVQGIRSQGLDVVLLGGIDGRDLSIQLFKELNDAHVLNFVGCLDLSQSAALIEQCRCFVGADSGLMHLASLVGVPVVAIFGPGNEKKWAPRGEKHYLIRNPVVCSPCTHFGYTVPSCAGRVTCMRQLNLSSVIQAVQEVINKDVG
jgi:ADP-heptose:LPS heptosyltransferase